MSKYRLLWFVRFLEWLSLQNPSYFVSVSILVFLLTSCLITNPECFQNKMLDHYNAQFLNSFHIPFDKKMSFEDPTKIFLTDIPNISKSISYFLIHPYFRWVNHGSPPNSIQIVFSQNPEASHCLFLWSYRNSDPVLPPL